MAFASIMDYFTTKDGKSSRRTSQRSLTSSTVAPDSRPTTSGGDIKGGSRPCLENTRTMRIDSIAARSITGIQDMKQVTWRAWVAIAAGVCQQVLCWGMIMTFGTILTFYTNYLLLNTRKWQICLVGTIPPTLLLFLSLLWGRLLDAGYHRHINIFAGVCITAGLTGLAFTSGNGSYGDGKYWAIAVAAIPVGVGQSCYFLSAPHMAKTWMPNHKGFAMGITNSGAAFGGSTLPFVFIYCTKIGGFRAGVGALAAFALVLNIFIAWASIPAPSFQPRPMSDMTRFQTLVPMKAFHSNTFRIHIAAMCCIYLGILTIPFLIELWAQKNHLGNSEDSRKGDGIRFGTGDNLTVYFVVAMNACQLPGRWAGSALCDYLPARKIHLTASIITVLLISTFWFLARSFAAGMTFAGLFGTTFGVMVSLPINDAQEILGAERTTHLGQYAGVVYTCASPFILMGGIFSGLLIDKAQISAAGIWAASTIGAGACLIALSLWVKDDTWKFDHDSDPSKKRFSVDVESVRVSERGKEKEVEIEANNGNEDGHGHGRSAMEVFTREFEGKSGSGKRSEESIGRVGMGESTYKRKRRESNANRSIEDAMMDTA